MTDTTEDSALPIEPAEQRPPKLLDLPERLDLNAADELAEALEHLRETPLDLNAARVSQLSALCLQVLIATKRQWDQDQAPLRIIDPSEAFTSGLERLGVPLDFFVQGEVA
ncbi:STAS domain-containing protein [Plastorhodobacter daqingensis]|uniref:STAS domain-containing protein n=1 Tax=Plastorhodobacter daqingensis TaxID=1387281 RepID=A0ABW2UNQ3_9RHOB